MSQADLAGDPLGLLKLLDGVRAPGIRGFQRREVDGHTHLFGVLPDALHILRTHIDRLEEHRERIKLRDCFEGRTDVGFIAVGIRWCDGDIHIEPGLLCGLECFETLHHTRSMRLEDAGKRVVQRRQAHPKHEPIAEALHQLEVRLCKRASGENADVEGGFVADEFQRAPHHFSMRLRQTAAEGLVRIGGRAEHHRPIAFRLQFFQWAVLGSTEALEECAFIPRAEQHISTPLGIGIFNAEWFELRGLLVRRDVGHVTKPATVRATDAGVERPIAETFQLEVIRGDGGWLLPDSGDHLARCGFSIHGRGWILHSRHAVTAQCLCERRRFVRRCASNSGPAAM